LFNSDGKSIDLGNKLAFCHGQIKSLKTTPHTYKQRNNKLIKLIMIQLRLRTVILLLLQLFALVSTEYVYGEPEYKCPKK